MTSAPDGPCNTLFTGEPITDKARRQATTCCCCCGAAGGAKHEIIVRGVRRKACGPCLRGLLIKQRARAARRAARAPA